MQDSKIPETGFERKKLLCEQLALLAEKSKECEPFEIAELTKAMAVLEKVIQKSWAN